MTFYQELQLSSTGSKQLIRSTTDPKEKRRHILIYNFKVYLVMAFCVAVVSMYSKQQQCSWCYCSAGSTCAATGRLRDQDNTWTAFYCRDFRYSYGRSPSGKYGTSVSCICSECSVYFFADDTGLSQCDHVQSFHLCAGISAASGI